MTIVVEPGTGELASKGEYGAGRLAEPAELLAAIEAAARPRRPGPARSTACSVLVTAGGTREPIDSVRYIGNRSSGRMGFAMAEVAADLGADVTVLAANVELPRDPRVTYVDVQTAQELRDAAIDAFGRADVLLMAAAVVDFRPALASDHKLKKSEGQDRMQVDLELTPDILSELAAAQAPGPDGGRVRGRARRRRAGLRTRQAAPQETGRHRGQRHLPQGHRVRRRPTTR